MLLRRTLLVRDFSYQAISIVELVRLLLLLEMLKYAIVEHVIQCRNNNVIFLSSAQLILYTKRRIFFILNCTKLSLLADLRPNFVVQNAIIIAARCHISLNDKAVAIVLILKIVSFDKRNREDGFILCITLPLGEPAHCHYNHYHCAFQQFPLQYGHEVHQ